LLESLADALPIEDQSIAAEYVEYDEWGLGMEHALDTLQESERRISPEQYAEVERLCNLMGLDNRWTTLR